MPKRSKRFTRRMFLAAAGSAVAGMALPQLAKRSSAAQGLLNIPRGMSRPEGPEWDFIQPRPARLDLWGRTTATTALREMPGLNQTVLQWLYPNTVMPLFEEIHAEGPNPHNDLWYRVEGGYIYTATVQPMAPYRMPQEVRQIDSAITDEKGDTQPGFWAEVIVPYTVARIDPSGLPVRLDDDSAVYLYYASVYRVIDAQPDTADNLYYKVHEDKPKTPPFYVLARHMRRIPESAFAPLSPGADKRIVVMLDEQRLDCYEGDQRVYSTLVSSGGGGFGTPRGEHSVVYKQPSRHMFSDPEQEAFSDPDFFDLPGVPYNIFFTTLGHAIHGTYWHGDYGRPRSHGCLNVTPEAAHWLFRWTDPPPPYDQTAVGSASQPGTPITVV